MMTSLLSWRAAETAESRFGDEGWEVGSGGWAGERVFFIAHHARGVEHRHCVASGR